MTDWRRISVFAAVNIAGALAACLIVALVLEVLNDQQREMAALDATIARAKATAVRNVEFASLAPDETLRLSARFLQGDTMGLVSADLLRRVNAVVEQEGGVVGAVTSLPEEEWRGRRLVGVQVDLTATDIATAKILTAIETGECLLFVRRARIAPGAANAPGGAQMLQAKVEVWGATGW